jgi:cytoskeleton protein RodZ
MPEIGDQLRETRMRNRIDISEVEAATKIRAKYLRALENEEWDLLPGPTFVKTFLRTYADYLGLDARNLVEQYRARYERPSAQELTPFGTSVGGRRSRPRRPVAAPWMAVIAGVLVLIGALYLLGTWGDDDGDGGDETSATATPVGTPAAGEGEGEKKKKRKRTPAKKTVVRLQIQPTGPVSVCLENAAGEPLIQNITLQANQDSETFRSKRFRMSFGTGEAVMRVDGKPYQVSDDAPIGYEVRAGGKPKPLPEAERPTCE